MKRIKQKCVTTPLQITHTCTVLLFATTFLINFTSHMSALNTQKKTHIFADKIFIFFHVMWQLVNRDVQ